MARTKRVRSNLPRVSSPAGIKARQATRLAKHVDRVPKGGSGFQYQRPPGSGNPRKVGRG